MKKINKVTNVALIFMLIEVVLTPARAYSTDTTHLRVPIQPATYNRIKDIIKQDDSLVPDLKAQAFIDLEKEWKRISSKFSAQNVSNARRAYTGNTFLQYGIDEAVKPIIEDDISKAREGDKKLAYIVSCGQYTDISWLIYTLTELIPKAERPSWGISIIVTNIRSESLKLAASAVEDSSLSGLSIKGYYLNIDIRSKEQVSILDGLLAKYNLYGAADGIMHNMGGNVIENAAGYHKLLRRLAKEGSWLEIDRRRISNTDYLTNIANAGFTRIGNENKFYTIFKAGSSVPEAKIVIESFLKIPLAGNIVIVNVMIGNQLYEISGIGVKKLLAVDLTSEVVKDPKECINIANLVNAVDGRLGEAAREEKWDWWTPQPAQTLSEKFMNNLALSTEL